MLVSAGCGAGAQPDAKGSAAPADAQTTLTAAIASVRAAGTATFDTKITTNAGERVEREVRGSYDLGRDLWAASTSMQSWLPDGGTGANYVADTVGQPGRYYVRARSGVPTDMLDKWAWIDTSTAPDLSAESQALLHVLGQIKAVEVRATEDGSVVTGTLPSVDAAGVLGLNKAVQASKLDAADLAGTSEITVSLDKSGHLTRVDLAGEDVTFTSAAVPAKIRDLAAGTTYSNTFAAHGSPVDIFVPGSAEEIDVDLNEVEPA